MNNALLLALLLATGAHPAAAAIRDAAGSGLVLEHGTPPRHRDGVTRHALRVTTATLTAEQAEAFARDLPTATK